MWNILKRHFETKYGIIWGHVAQTRMGNMFAFHINGLYFFKTPKTSFLGHFEPFRQNWGKQDFFRQKLGCHFRAFMDLNFM